MSSSPNNNINNNKNNNKNKNKRRRDPSPPPPAELSSEESEPTSSQKLWPVKQILGERKSKYLLAWEGIDPDSGKEWKPTWEWKDCATPALIKDWDEGKKLTAAKRKKKGKSTATPAKTSTSTRPRRPSLPAQRPLPPTNREASDDDESESDADLPKPSTSKTSKAKKLIFKPPTPVQDVSSEDDEDVPILKNKKLSASPSTSKVTIPAPVPVEEEQEENQDSNETIEVPDSQVQPPSTLPSSSAPETHVQATVQNLLAALPPKEQLVEEEEDLVDTDDAISLDFDHEYSLPLPNRPTTTTSPFQLPAKTRPIQNPVPIPVPSSTSHSLPLPSKPIFKPLLKPVKLPQPSAFFPPSSLIPQQPITSQPESIQDADSSSPPDRVNVPVKTTTVATTKVRLSSVSTSSAMVGATKRTSLELVEDLPTAATGLGLGGRNSNSQSQPRVVGGGLGKPVRPIASIGGSFRIPIGVAVGSGGGGEAGGDEPEEEEQVAAVATRPRGPAVRLNNRGSSLPFPRVEGGSQSSNQGMLSRNSSFTLDGDSGMGVGGESFGSIGGGESFGSNGGGDEMRDAGEGAVTSGNGNSNGSSNGTSSATGGSNGGPRRQNGSSNQGMNYGTASVSVGSVTGGNSGGGDNYQVPLTRPPPLPPIIVPPPTTTKSLQPQPQKRDHESLEPNSDSDSSSKKIKTATLSESLSKTQQQPLLSPMISRVLHTDPFTGGSGGGGAGGGGTSSPDRQRSASPSSFSRNASPAPTSMPPVVVELIRSSATIGDHDTTKLELIKFIQDPSGYAKTDGPLMKRPLWAFELRKYNAEKIDIVIVNTLEGTFQLKRMPLQVAATLDVSKSLTPPPQVQAPAPATAPALPPAPSLAPIPVPAPQRPAVIPSVLEPVPIDPAPIPAKAMTRDQLEQEYETLRVRIRHQESELLSVRPLAAEASKLRVEVASLTKANKSLLSSKETSQSDFAYIQRQYQEASNAAVARANEALVAETEVKRLSKMLQTGLEQRTLFQKGESKRLNEEIDRLKLELKLFKAERSRTDDRVIREKASKWSDYLAEVKSREEAERKATSLDEDETDEPSDDDFVEGSLSSNFIATGASLDSNESVLFACEWREDPSSQCKTAVKTKEELRSHILVDHLPPSIPRISSSA